MKKIVAIVVLIVILLISSSICIISYNKYVTIEKENMDLEEKIKKIDIDNKQKKEENVTLSDNISKIQEELKEEIEKYNQWVKTKENLTLALS